MGYIATTVLQCITGPDGGISIVQIIFIRIKISGFPIQMPFDDRPGFSDECRIPCPIKMPEQTININQVHVIMMGLHGLSIGQSADVPTAEHSYIIFLPTARKMHGRIGYNWANSRTGELRQCIGIKMNFCPIVPTQWICCIRAPPTIQPHAPANSTMHIGRSFPNGIGCNAEGSSNGIDIWIRCFHCDSVGHCLPCLFCLLKNSSQITVGE